METKFTKGEWGGITHSISRRWFSIDSKKGFIARAFYGDEKPIVTMEEAEANAKLIAAAPALYKALEQLIEAYKELIMGERGVPLDNDPEIKRATAA